MTENLKGAAALLLCVGMLAACGAPEEVANIQPQISVQSKAAAYVQLFQVAALRQTATDGANITCRDFPGTYSLGDSRLPRCSADGSVAAKCEVQVPWELGKETEARAELQVPFNERLIFVVQGMATSPLGGAHTVVRGCTDNVIFAPGTPHQTIAIEALATTGAACPTGTGCETGMQCHQDPTYFPGGYCSKLPCSSDAECPPGGVCISDPTLGGLCARPCNATQDCAGAGTGTQLYACEGRLGVAGCQRVCVWPQYNIPGKC